MPFLGERRTHAGEDGRTKQWNPTEGKEWNALPGEMMMMVTLMTTIMMMVMMMIGLFARQDGIRFPTLLCVSWGTWVGGMRNVKFAKKGNVDS